ncbi:MAG: hypothetical protein OSB21_04995, partial [Myxococcota bacterium]|nr:hypothetical protein [Myxococcota bacterium]
MKKLLPLLVFAACSAPNVVVDTSAPTLRLQGPAQLKTGAPNIFQVSATAPSGRAIHSLSLHVQRRGSVQRASLSLSAVDEAEFCVRLDPSVSCDGYMATFDLPSDFGSDGLQLSIVAEAQDNGPARRLGTSEEHIASVLDTSAPLVELLAPDNLQPNRTIALRLRITDLHSEAASVNYRLTLLSNGCVSNSIEGVLNSFLPDGDSEIALITVPVPEGLRSGSLQIEQIEVSDSAVDAN